VSGRTTVTSIRAGPQWLGETGTIVWEAHVVHDNPKTAAHWHNQSGQSIAGI
jgi:hypothetical protein